MAERIYVVGEQGLEPLTEEPFSSEDMLQALIAEHPELLDGEQIRPDDPRRWILITREMGIAETPNTGARWAIDHLLIDQDAVPTLVEVKRGANSEIRRTIVGQLLEYAAHATRTWPVDDLRRIFEEATAARGLDPSDLIGELLREGGDPDADAFWRDVATNLAAKRVRLLFVADEIPDPLAQVVEFLNAQMPDIEVLAVEIKQFRGGSNQILVPRVIGRIAALPKGGSSNRPTLKRASFEEQFSIPVARQAAARLLDVALESGASLGWGSRGVSIRGRCSLWPQPVTVAWLYPTSDIGWGRTRSFSFGAGIFDSEKIPDELLSLLQEWTDQFASDDFTEDVSSQGVIAWAVTHAAAIEHLDLLATRLTSVLSNLKAL